MEGLIRDFLKQQQMEIEELADMQKPYQKSRIWCCLPHLGQPSLQLLQGKAVKYSIALFPKRFPLQVQTHPQLQKVDKASWVPSYQARVVFDITLVQSLPGE